MLKRVRRKVPEKDRVGQDLFSLTKTIEHGFPYKASAVAYDSKLSLLAIGTRTGFLKIFGKPGVELSAQHPTETSIQQLFFLPEQGRIISVCDDGELNTLHLWEINTREGKSILEEVKACTLEGRLKKISVCCLSMERECLYIGTEGGHIYVLDLNSFGLKDHIIYQDIVMQSLPGDEHKANGGSVEALEEHPFDSSKLLIGYKRGIIVLWNQDKIKAEGTFKASQDLEGLYWHSDATQFISAHEHGNLSIWSIPEKEYGETVQDCTTPYGPFPCKAIRKVEWHEPYVIFSGGLPRASYGDKHAVSLMTGGTPQVVFDFTSNVIDFFTVKDSSGTGEPIALAVLCEQEFVLVDLKSKEEGYPTYVTPYLACLHSSNITCKTHCTDCPEDVWNTIFLAGVCKLGAEHSKEPWPITGGRSLLDDSSRRDLLVTGHEDGCVRFWDASQISLRPIYTLAVNTLFQSEFDSGGPRDDDEGEEDWPPFKKVGSFDPCVDDQRFVILKLVLCPVTKTLAVGGAGGQIVLYDLAFEGSSIEPEVQELNIIEKLEGFEWKGHGPLALKEGSIDIKDGICPKRILQLKPPSAITALVLHTGWGLLAAGTCHGFIVYDYIVGRQALIKCTISPTDLANQGGNIRRKSFAKSLRDSIRRFRSRRSSRRSKRKPRKGGEGEEASAPAGSPGSSSPIPYNERSSAVRLVDENRVDEALLSMVRCLYFGETFLTDAVHHAPTLWAGTNAGYIYVYSVTVPDEEKRHEESVQIETGKEIKLKHRAPVVSIFVVDRNGVPLPNSKDVEMQRAKEADMTGQHSVVICSEEQFKVFSLPALRARNKEKLTAVDGSRVRRIGLVEVYAKHEEENVLYHFMVCLSNYGDLSIYAIPSLKLLLRVNVAKKEDKNAIQSLIFTQNGQGFYLRSTTEIQRFCLISTDITNLLQYAKVRIVQKFEKLREVDAGAISLRVKADCKIDLPEGMRPHEEHTDEEGERTEQAKEEKSPRSPSNHSQKSSSPTPNSTSKVIEATPDLIPRGPSPQQSVTDNVSETTIATQRTGDASTFEERVTVTRTMNEVHTTKTSIKTTTETIVNKQDGHIRTRTFENIINEEKQVGNQIIVNGEES